MPPKRAVRRPVRPRRVSPKGPALASPFAGIDTATIDPRRGATWYGELYKLSNFSFAGCYLTEAIEAADRNNFTTASGNISNHWTQQYNNLRRLPGPWGFVFWHMGYSEIAGGPMRDRRGNPIIDPATGLPRDEHFFVMPTIPWTERIGHDLGILGAQRIKRIVHNLGPETTGAIVYVDIEPSLPIRKEIWAYYRALFREVNMYRPGEHMPVRAGTYAPLTTAGRLLDLFPDLFIWTVDARVFHGDTWDQSDGTLKFKFNEFPINTIQHVPERMTDPVLHVPVGRQGLINFTSKMPHPPLRTLVGIAPWDFDQSFVRDPRFPEAADPRFAVAEKRLIIGSFSRTTGSMVISQQHTPRQTLFTGVKIEPESPIITTSQRQVFLLDVTGQIAMSTQIDANTWSPLATIVPLAPARTTMPLRRIRALTVTARSATDTQLFYVASDLTLQARRLKDRDPWTTPARMCSTILVHPFSKLTSVASPQGIVDVFFINTDGVLTNASTASIPPRGSSAMPFPGNTSQPLDADPPVLLPGTHLAAAKPSERQIAIFGISNTLRLTVAVHTDGSDWGPLQMLGDDKQTLFAHSHLATLATSDRVILVAAIAQNTDPVVYTVTLTGSAAAATRIAYPRKAVPLPETAGGVLPRNAASAIYFDVNPWGDLALSRVDPPAPAPGAGAAARGPNTILSITGCHPGQGAILQKRVNGLAPDWSMLLV
ncbi:hypothetical protein FH972_022178 [Carpinus fangiana]|uniref:Uncharacterized protein n=1 Tax=Carpinus fangiana TaxID=176857 RepID=A0A5N6KS42_9ROSI|nr:hypothetical protein FH972_022178 [Carpinus fangiana]